MPAVALSRVGARVVGPGPGGEDLTGAWQRLEALPDPRSPRGGLPAGLPGGDRGLRVHRGRERPVPPIGQWVGPASGPGPAARSMGSAGRIPAPDRETIRVVLDRLDPRPDRALLRRPSGRPRRRAAAAACAATRAARRPARRWPAPGCGGGGGRQDRPRRPPCRRHPGAPARSARPRRPLLDHLEVASSTTRPPFAELLEPMDLAGAVVTFDALHTVRANLDWLVKDKKAHYIAIVKRDQPRLHAKIKALPWRQIPAGGRGREGARPRRNPHPEDRTRQPPGAPAPARPSRSPAGGRTRHRQGLPTAWRTSLTSATPPRRTWPAWSASTGPSRRTITSVMSLSVGTRHQPDRPRPVDLATIRASHHRGPQAGRLPAHPRAARPHHAC